MIVAPGPLQLNFVTLRLKNLGTLIYKLVFQYIQVEVCIYLQIKDDLSLSPSFTFDFN